MGLVPLGRDRERLLAFSALGGPASQEENPHQTRPRGQLVSDFCLQNREQINFCCLSI